MELGKSAIFNEQLIDLVKDCHCLYNKKHKRYFDNNFKNNCWKEISSKLNRNPEECKTRWKHLRETFCKKSKPKTTGSGAEEDTWPYFENMMFLRTYIQPRSTRNNENRNREESLQSIGDDSLLEEENNPESVDLFSSPSPGTPQPKRKCSAQSTLKIIEDAALAVREKAKAGQEKDGNSSNELIYKTIMSLLNEIPKKDEDKARAELFQFVFALKEKYSAK